MQLLVEAFNQSAIQSLMCHQTLSVAWDGRLYDCDFNQQLDLPISSPTARSSNDAAAVAAEGGSTARGDEQQQRRRGLTVWDLDSLDDLTGVLIKTGSHCYGCTAGSGSSCQGATAD